MDANTEQQRHAIPYSRIALPTTAIAIANAAARGRENERVMSTRREGASTREASERAWKQDKVGEGEKGREEGREGAQRGRDINPRQTHTGAMIGIGIAFEW